MLALDATAVYYGRRSWRDGAQATRAGGASETDARRELHPTPECMGNPNSIEVRPAGPADADCITDFNARMALETEGRSLNRALLGQGVEAVLADAGRGRYFVAEERGSVLGCLLLTYEWSDWRNAWFWWIQSVYVSVDSRGRGVFRSLYDHVVASARADADACGVRLYVERENVAAQEVYRRVGMERTRYEMYEVDFVLHT